MKTHFWTGSKTSTTRSTKKSLRRLKSSKGFTLVEVMIAITVFALFITAYIGAEGQNLMSSGRMKTELNLQVLCQQVLNQLILDPPQWNPALELKPEVKKFEDDELSSYQYSIEYRQLELPTYEEITMKDNEDEKADAKEDTINKRIYGEMKKYLDKRIWMVEIRVEDTESKESFSITHWLENDKVKPQIKI